MLLRIASGVGRKFPLLLHLHPPSNCYAASHFFPFAPLTTSTCQPSLLDYSSVHLLDNNRAPLLDHLTALGFEQQIIDSLACLPLESFTLEWRKIQLLFNKGVHPTQVRALLMPSTSPRKLHFHSVTHAKLDSVLNLLEKIQLSVESPIRALTVAALLRCRLERLVGKLDRFNRMGLGPGMSKLVLKRPSFILNTSLASIQERITAIEATGLDRKDLQRIVNKYPKILIYSIDKSIIPKLTYLENLGVSKMAVLKFLVRIPSIAGVSTETIAKKVEVLQGLGVSKSPDRILFALSYLCSFRCETIQARADWFKSRGFSSEDIGTLLKFPVVFQKTEQQLEKRMNYLENVLERDKREVLRCPVYLVCSFDDRIVHRFDILRDKGLLDAHISLGFVLYPSDAAFKARVTKLEDSKCK